MPFKTVLEYDGEEHIFVVENSIGFLCAQCSLYDSKNDKCRIHKRLLKSLGVYEEEIKYSLYSPCAALGIKSGGYYYGTFFMKKDCYDKHISQKKEKVMEKEIKIDIPEGVRN